MWFRKKKEKMPHSFVYPFSDILEDLLNSESIEKREKAAILVVYFKDNKDMIEALKNAREDILHQLTFEIARKTVINPDEYKKVIAWLDETVMDYKKQLRCGIEVSREILEKSVGTQKTIDIVNNLTSSLQVTPFSFIKRTHPKYLANILKNEMNQTIAVVCSYIGEEQAANLLEYLPYNQRIEVIIKISSMSRVSPDVLREVERVIERKISTLASEDFCDSGGMDYVSKILILCSEITKELIIDDLEEENPELAEEIRKKVNKDKKEK
jgi:flagellar motor switch protein FliG